MLCVYSYLKTLQCGQIAASLLIVGYSAFGIWYLLLLMSHHCTKSISAVYLTLWSIWVIVFSWQKPNYSPFISFKEIVCWHDFLKIQSKVSHLNQLLASLLDTWQRRKIIYDQNLDLEVGWHSLYKVTVLVSASFYIISFTHNTR